MAILNVISNLLKCDVSDYEAGMKKAKSATQKLNEEAKAHEKQLQTAAKRWRDFGDVLTGAGLLAGVFAIGRSLDKATDSLIKMRDQMRDGKADIGDFVEQMAKGVPIIGSFWSAGRGFRELVTGEQAAIDAQTQMTALVTQEYNLREKINDLLKKQAHDQMAAIESADRKLQLQNLANAPYQQTQLNARFGFSDQVSGIIGDYAKQQSDRDALIPQLVKNLRDQNKLSGLQDELDEARRSLKIAERNHAWYPDNSHDTAYLKYQQQRVKEDQGAIAAEQRNRDLMQSQLDEARRRSASFVHYNPLSSIFNPAVIGGLGGFNMQKNEATQLGLAGEAFNMSEKQTAEAHTDEVKAHMRQLGFENFTIVEGIRKQILGAWNWLTMPRVDGRHAVTNSYNAADYGARTLSVLHGGGNNPLLKTSRDQLQEQKTTNSLLNKIVNGAKLAATALLPANL